jgi:hypothetical protein
MTALTFHCITWMIDKIVQGFGIPCLKITPELFPLFVINPLKIFY